MGKAATRAKNKYNAENYDRINLSVPKGKNDEYNKAASEKGFYSLNKFIIHCIEKRDGIKPSFFFFVAFFFLIY